MTHLVITNSQTFYKGSLFEVSARQQPVNWSEEEKEHGNLSPTTEPAAEHEDKIMQITQLNAQSHYLFTKFILLSTRTV